LLFAIQAGAGYVDFEFADWSRSATARHDLAAALADPAVVGHAPRLILSHHDFDRRPADLDALVRDLCAVGEAGAIKIAWPARDILDNFDAFDIMRTADKDAVVICMGDTGLMSRVLAGKCGALASYCALDADSAAAPGQLTLAQMRDRYRWDVVNEATEVYGVIGCPVAHSIGPYVFNDAFARQKINAVYLPLPVSAEYDAFAAFMDACLQREWFGARGFSVTLPHKMNALRYLGDRVDPPADLIGAVNTIRIEEGEVWGCNTDCDAAVDMLLGGMGCAEEDLEGVRVDVLGAGGVSRAVVAGLTDCGCDVTVYNRDPDRADELADTFDCQSRPWDDRTGAQGTVLINCTRVGMWPDVDASPMPADALRADTVVFDAVYRPRRTRLLRDAESAGCTVIDGVGMFVRQAAMQCEYWTHQPADEQRIRAIVEETLAAD
ncbi:MAG: type I 3-dehydroquinate dehydratase, partial [Phycisphaerae bacterium]